MFKKKWIVLLSLLIVLSGCNGASENKEASLVSLSVTPAAASIAVDTDVQFIATGIYSDNTTKDLTANVDWSSSDPEVAVIAAATGTTKPGPTSLSDVSGAAAGHAYGTGEGTALITASFGRISGSADLKVRRSALVSISVSPTNPGVAKGTNQQFTATGTFEDDTTQDLTALVKWSSSNTSTAAVSNTAGSQGLATSTQAGLTTITAGWGNIVGTTTLTVNPATLVSIAVTPTNPAIAQGTNQQFTAIGTYSDNSTQDVTNTVTWSSSDTAAATISSAAGSKGLAASGAAGSTVITATAGSISGATTLTVNAVTLVSIAITPTNSAVAKGTNQQFTATGTYSDNTTQNLTGTVVWSSSNTGAATISNAAGSQGLATSVAAGSTTIKAASGNITGTTTLTVNSATLVSIAITPADPGIAKGTRQQFTATGTYSDETTQNITASVTWASSDSAIATISNAAGSKGLATSVESGSTTITATSGMVSGTTSLTVNPASLLSITVTPAGSGMARGTTQQFTATGSYSDNTTQDLTKTVTWSSSNTAVSTISNAAGSNGLATAAATGTTTIKALSGSVTGSTQLTVNPASLVSIKVSPADATIGIGTTQQYSATGTYSDNSTQNLTKAVTWSSSNDAAATVSNAAGSNGLATAVATGTTTIKAVSGSISGSSALTIVDRSVSLAWDAPTTNTDGSSLTDLSGYKLHYGTSSGRYTTTITVGNGTSYVINNLNPGTYYFTVTSVNSAGIESDYSGETYKIIP